MLADALVVMVLGMGTVFAVLLGLLVLMEGCAWFARRLGTADGPSEPAPAALPAAEAEHGEAHHPVAIGVAAAHHLHHGSRRDIP